MNEGDEMRLAEIRDWIATPGTITERMPRSLDDREEDVFALLRLLDTERAERARLELTIRTYGALVDALTRDEQAEKARATQAESALAAAGEALDNLEILFAQRGDFDKDAYGLLNEARATLTPEKS